MMEPMVCIANWFVDVTPPIIIAIGRIHRLRLANTMIQTIQPARVPVEFGLIGCYFSDADIFLPGWSSSS
jgi:hypothetical protein